MFIHNISKWYNLNSKNTFYEKNIDTHDWNNDKPYEGDLQTLNGK